MSSNARRLKISIACQSCRSRKVRCDGVRPACSNCQKKDVLRESCTYNTTPTEGSSPRRSHPLSQILPAPASTNLGQQDEHDVQPKPIGIFAVEAKAAIDARLGLPSGGGPNPIPMSDAPLFGNLSRPQISGSAVHSMDNVLPPRKHADHLMDIYWRHIQPLEPLLEEEGFSRSYKAFFSGTLLDHEERTFVSALNTVFALPTQLQECMQPEQREEASHTYFHRAWALLRPEMIIWEPGSLEIVQCLLLMSRYLQCTNNPHQTWMAIGSAVRIAQSLGLHLSGSASSSHSNRDTRLRRQLWQCCVFMDRQISWVLGRTSFLQISPAGIDSLHDSSLDIQYRVSSSQYFTKMLELYEINNHVMLSQMSTSNSLADKLGLPRLYRNEDYFGSVVQLDACLNKWEENLPRCLRIEIFPGDRGEIVHRQAVMLRLRLLHGRIHLFRPMLARFCLSNPPSTSASSLDQGLKDRVSHQCASLCIQNAQRMIDLIQEYQKADGTIGIIPWWYRVFYLHIAGTMLIAASLRTEIFTPLVSQSWNKAMEALHAHEHLSPFVQQCVTTFQTLSGKTRDFHPHQQKGVGEVPTTEAVSTSYFHDAFLDMGFDPDNFLFGKEDMSWLSSLDPAQSVP